MKKLIRHRLPAAAVIATALFATLCVVEAAFAADDPLQAPPVQLPGHVLTALSKATLLPKSAKADASDEDALSLTVVLRRTDEAGFQAYLDDVYDPASRNFRKYLSPAQISERFGPSERDYAAVSTYFTQKGFVVGEASANRMTLVVNGTRTLASQALAVGIRDYQIADKRFYANDAEPALPAEIASRVQSVVGLSNLATPRPMFGAVGISFFCSIVSIGAFIANIVPDGPAAYAAAVAKCRKDVFNKGGFYIWAWQVKDPPPPAWQGVDGTGQTVGVVAFNGFQASDVSNFLSLVHLPATMISNLSKVHVGGGATSSAVSDETETLLDVDSVMTIAQNAKVAVYDAPFTGAGSFQAIFNAMLNGGVTIISNSFAYCEDQTTLADVQSIETILQTAAGAGVTVVSASGDNGSTCLDGAANTLHVPASAPHATAVGGTSATYGPGHVYGSETWWNGTAGSPPTGQGGFGVSRFFASPSYQTGLNTNAMRSIPDIALNADPAALGVEICQTDAGGCPTGSYYGGTSVSAPNWAAYVALLNQSQGSNLGFMNPLLYPLANTNSFHSAASMGSDFAHVGLGSPNVNQLHQRLTNQTPGSVDPTLSEISAYYLPNFFPLLTGMSLPADGTTQTSMTVHLSDTNGNLVGGKTVRLAANAGAHAVITPATAVTDANTGAAVFTVSDATVEALTFTATDVTDNVVLSQTLAVNVAVPTAAGGSISAVPTAVPNDGTSTTTITVTLRDAQNKPSPGKVVTLAQAGGHSVITGPSPGVTDATGTIQFTASDQSPESVTYTAVDVSDGNLAVPGSAVVTFSGQANASCVAATPTAAPGFTVTAFSTGYFAQNFFFGNVNWGGCPGASNPTFSPSNNVYVANFRTGDLFEFGLGGGAISNADKISNLNQTLGQPTFGKDGRLYATHGATTGDFTTGNIVEVDPTTGAQIRVVASNLTCPNSLAVDPLSGDLFFDDQCFGAGSNNPSLWRIRDPAGAATLSVYATLPTSPNGAISFSPDGTIYVDVGYLDAAPQVVTVSGTNMPMPPTITPIPNLSSNYWVTVGAAQSNGAAKSLILLEPAGLTLVDITTTPYTTTLLLSNQSAGSGVIGPDGCLYSAVSDTIYKLTTSAGTCGFVPTNPVPALSLSPATVSPNPAQGTSQTLTATFNNVSVGAGVPVTFIIVGANTQTKLATTNASGVASITYVGARTGTDKITASGTAGGTLLTSNSASITWAAGKDVSLLTLNTSPSSGASGIATSVVAALTDTSLTPNAPIAGVTIQFSLGGATCSGVTNAQGVAACNITPSAGQLTLTATFAGNVQYTASTASQRFSVLSATGPTVPGAPTVGAAAAGDGFIVVSFAPPASSGGSAITQYVATCTPVGSGANVSGTGASSPITVAGVTNGVTYTCAVSAVNSVGTGASSAASNQATPMGLVPFVPMQIPMLDRTNEAILAALLAFLAACALWRRQRGR